MSEYERIKAKCLEQRVLWEDPEFPAVQESVFYNQVPPFTFEWKRATELYRYPEFIHTCDIFDVVSGRLGDNWLLSAVGVLYLCKGLFSQVVPSDQDFFSCYFGVFRFRIWWCGEWVEVLVDDRLPTVNGQLAFMHSIYTDQLWPALLEKALAKIHGSYEALKYGNLMDGLASLTGGVTETFPMSEIDEPELLSKFLKTSSIVTCRQSESLYNHTAVDVGINYRVYAIEEVDTEDGSTHVVRLAKPPRLDDLPLTHLVFNLAKWSLIHEHERNRLTSTDTGFWMLFSDFQATFTNLEVVHVSIDACITELSLADKEKWLVNTHKGRWKKGVTAGGCRNHLDSFHVNPQIQLTVHGPDTVIIALNQHSILEPKVIGCTLYKLPTILNETASPTFFKITKTYVNSKYSNCRQVSMRCYLHAGAHLAIPTTFEPRQEGNFSLVIYSTKPVMMTVLDCPPQMFRSAFIKAPADVELTTLAQYQSQFAQVCDEHKTIDAFELQELLEKCLPNDYIKSSANIDTCRQIIMSLENDGDGRITISDFRDLICSLRHWQAVFREYTQEKMSVLRVEKLRDALRAVGFVVPEKAMTLLVLKFMRKDGMVRFGDFVSAVALLQRAFNIFYKNISTPASPSNVNLKFSEWLKTASMC